MRILFFLLITIIIFNNMKLYEGLDSYCDTFKDDMKNNCSATCKNYDTLIEDKSNDYPNNGSGIKGFKIYLLTTLNKILKTKSDCNKCMNCIIEQTSDKLKESEKKT